MAETKIKHPSVEERAAKGKDRREKTPVSSHTGWAPAPDRPDPVALLEEQNLTREQDLVPVRHGRMLVSPFTFYRGAAKIMATDLKDTPRAGLKAQLCGDAHLSNFGVFASPERNLLFDLNDFDETLPGPFEYDVKRMAASFTIAARNNEFTKAEAHDVTLSAVRAYREAMKDFSRMGTMDIWYAHLSEQELMSAIETAASSEIGKAQKKAVERVEKRTKKSALKAHTRDSLQALSKLGELVDGQYRIVSQPPIVIPVRELAATYGMSGDEVEKTVREQLRAYRATLPDDRRLLLERFEVIDVARKVVGVGSVGTRAFIALLQGRDQEDPLFLQVKEATRSVLEDHLPKSKFKQPGERVVRGQRMMQAASDIFLGWTKGAQDNRYLYWRQLRDMKGSAVIEEMKPFDMTSYARVCGWTLARAHARSGDPIAIGAYLGKSDKFDHSITDFSERYADQNEHDYQAFSDAVRSGRLEAIAGV
ncbi:DUF2252 domain-containing protein [Arthrobacter sp. 131MFCol6.1]|uniref:DUF2252 domain-containing protein n=1 Tax=Arthrobacter sp. 131MFCol6.1 TaxID=1157944 RepID=UPI00036EDF5F|nr:DUF2252 domain-containing protein [Arthrobacter sp. 131MFCol6.1]